MGILYSKINKNDTKYDMLPIQSTRKLEIVQSPSILRQIEYMNMYKETKCIYDKINI